MLPRHFGRKGRFDGRPGYCEVTPTEMAFFEADGSDVRMRRVRVYNPDGILVRIYLTDMMGAPFADLPDVEDDPGFLSSLGDTVSLKTAILGHLVRS